MNMLVKTRLVKIGNSQGIRIPKWLLEQAGLTGEIEVEAQSGQLVIRPAQSARQGWDAQFQAMAQASDDRLLDGEPLALTEWEAGEWEW
ncbi:MAG TPA: AbrB/MazE/SpoVT family DNA-binding domain-containing protein [Chthonomonadaceae bacterium]|nr:AbrB/MazE/SpoVT family DNA-binding domain-containing protein [Chthonomonadaceae bacterium]